MRASASIRLQPRGGVNLSPSVSIHPLRPHRAHLPRVGHPGPEPTPPARAPTPARAHPRLRARTRACARTHACARTRAGARTHSGSTTARGGLGPLRPSRGGATALREHRGVQKRNVQRHQSEPPAAPGQSGRHRRPRGFTQRTAVRKVLARKQRRLAPARVHIGKVVHHRRQPGAEPPPRWPVPAARVALVPTRPLARPRQLAPHTGTHRTAEPVAHGLELRSALRLQAAVRGHSAHRRVGRLVHLRLTALRHGRPEARRLPPPQPALRAPRTVRRVRHGPSPRGGQTPVNLTPHPLPSPPVSG